MCSKLGIIQGRLSNIYYKLKVLRSKRGPPFFSLVEPHTSPFCWNRGVGKAAPLLRGETDISVCDSCGVSQI